MTAPMPYLTDREKRLHAADNGKHAAAAEAFLRLGLILETDEDSPAPITIAHTSKDGVVADILWGFIAPSSAGDEAGTAAVNRWAARHHVAADWNEGRYEAVMHLGGGYRYGVRYTPERVLYPPAPVPSAEPQPELAAAGKAA